jgi:hypothetical protein
MNNNVPQKAIIAGNVPVESEKDSQFERCILCNKKTSVPKALHIEFRNHYVEGAGQLCFQCFTKNLQYLKD